MLFNKSSDQGHDDQRQDPDAQPARRPRFKKSPEPVGAPSGGAHFARKPADVPTPKPAEPDAPQAPASSPAPLDETVAMPAIPRVPEVVAPVTPAPAASAPVAPSAPDVTPVTTTHAEPVSPAPRNFSLPEIDAPVPAADPAPTTADEVAPAPQSEAPAPVWQDGIVPGAAIAEAPVIGADPYSGKKSKAGKRILIGVGALVAILAVVYLGGAFAFRSHFYPNTTLNGRDISLKDAGYVEQAVEDEVAGYQVHVTSPSLDTTLTAGEAGLDVDSEAFVDSALEHQNSWFWPLQISQTHKIEQDVIATVDDAVLASALADDFAKANETSTEPVDAYVEYDKDAQAYVIVPEVPGSEIQEDAAVRQISEAMTHLSPEVELSGESLTQPAITSDNPDLVSLADSANALLAGTITLTLDGQEVKVIGPDSLNRFITLNGREATFDDAGFQKWAHDDLSAELDTAGTTRTYTRPDDGKEVEVSGGTYGWIIDSEALTPQIVEAVAGTEDVTIDIPCIQTASSWSGIGEPDWGNRWIDVDISEQYARMYDGGELVWESYIVSGNTSEGNGTPTGVFYINDKGTNVTLRGPKDPETGEYKWESLVSYWMPFYGGAYGLHDASWRGSFGGSIYTWNGSHGCVNLPTSNAEWLYNNISVGDVVIVHY